MTILLFLLAVSVLIKVGTVNKPWQGQGQGYIPQQSMTFWQFLGRLMGFAFGFTVMLLVSLMWLFSFIGEHHP